MRSVVIAPSAGGVGAIVAIALAAALGLYLFTQREKLAAAAGQALDLVNPLSSGNVAYRAANAVTQAVTGDSVNSLGTKIYEVVNDEIDPTKYSQAELERLTAAANHWGRDTGGWYVG